MPNPSIPILMIQNSAIQKFVPDLTLLSALKWWQGYHQEGLKYQLKASDYYAKPS